MPGLLQAQDLLVLHGTHRRDGFEMLMEGGCAHVHQLGQCVDVHRLGEMDAQPRKCLGNPLHPGFREADLRHAGAAGTAEQTDEHLVDHQGGE